MRHIYIIGSKGIPANYGGFETFVEQLTAGRQSEEIVYHVACMDEKAEVVRYNGAECFHLAVPSVGPAKAVYYDLKAIAWCLHDIRKNNIKDAVVYVLACRIGPFIGTWKKRLAACGAKLYVNPDGHEWKRAKWNYLIRKYWKFSEKLMVKHADLLICDSKNIESYIRRSYAKYHPATTYIAYGAAEAKKETAETAAKLDAWYQEHGVKSGGYYLVVGRFVPENNYETMLREFMESRTDKDFVLITNVEHNKFYEKLQAETGFDKDARIKFVGTVYDAALLALIRKNAYGYLHGHEVGGTNPSLLEALGSTDLNLLLDVGFNSEVARDGALYWSKEPGKLGRLLKRADEMKEAERKELGERAKERIRKDYSWPYIIEKYEKLFLEQK